MSFLNLGAGRPVFSSSQPSSSLSASRGGETEGVHGLRAQPSGPLSAAGLGRAPRVSSQGDRETAATSGKASRGRAHKACPSARGAQKPGWDRPAVLPFTLSWPNSSQGQVHISRKGNRVRPQERGKDQNNRFIITELVGIRMGSRGVGSTPCVAH